MSYKVWDSSLIPPEYLVDVNFDAPPKFDLKQLGFPKKETISYGLKRSVIFYDRFNKDRGVYEDPLLSIAWQTIFEEVTPIEQIRRVSWKSYATFWTHPHVSHQPVRNPKVFLQKRRSRIIEELVDLATKADLKDKILKLYEDYQSLIILYKDGGSLEFRDAIAKSKEPWLDRVNETTGNKPREVLVKYLSIGTVDILPPTESGDS